MEIFNLNSEQEWDKQQDKDGYRHRYARIGERLGASLLGASLYELPPGESSWPYHYESASEEWLLVALEVVTYPDSGKVGIWTRERGYIAMLRDEPDLDYWEGE